MKRSAGIILPVASLPSPYGIGTLGAAAREWIDWLAEAGQTWWQVLPVTVTVTASANSPYSSPSAFAGNSLLIDLDELVEQGLLAKRDASSRSWGANPARVDYETLQAKRPVVLHKAYEAAKSQPELREKLAAFEAEHATWLPDYALFMALKDRFDGAAWFDWTDEPLALHDAAACEAARAELADEVGYYAFEQYLFFTQWAAMREYAHEAGVRIIGDIPIYMALDSADVWSSSEWFQLNEKHRPEAVAGVPPDYFSEDGQLWGSPLYNYDAMEADGWGWWIRRIGGAAALYDVIRIDHFRGFEAYWSVPAEAETAKAGRWVKGPGMRLLRPVLSWFHYVDFIAEDLGERTPEVNALLAESGLPGMKVLQFAYTSDWPSDYQPHFYDRNCVCYTGTHDNDTLAGWLGGASAEELARTKAYLGLNDGEGFAWGVVRGGMGSVADLFMAQAQDYLGLGSEARTNVPGTTDGNWEWRLLPEQATPELAAKIAAITKRYGRLTR